MTTNCHFVPLDYYLKSKKMCQMYIFFDGKTFYRYLTCQTIELLAFRKYHILNIGILLAQGTFTGISNTCLSYYWQFKAPKTKYNTNTNINMPNWYDNKAILFKTGHKWFEQGCNRLYQSEGKCKYFPFRWLDIY